MATRLDRFRARMAEMKVPAALVTEPLNVGYLTGFSGSACALLVAAGGGVFITDSRYTSQAQRECAPIPVVTATGSGTYHEAILAQAQRLAVRDVAVEADYLSVTEYDRLKDKLKGLVLKPVPDLVDALRRVKDEDEINTIRVACGLADRGFEYLLTILKPGVTEREVAADLEHFLKRSGADKEGFDTIVASGERSAMPHGRASDRALREGDFITFDFGARVNGYNSDITRTVVLGRASDRQREVYAVVLEAQLAGLAAIRAGASGKAVDAVARDLIARRGYGENFGHGLGHGLGRKVHDHRALTPHEDVTLEAGMVITVEPGVYVEGWGGVRIEDDVLVTDTGCEILTHATKELIEI